nr:retrotransposon protein, putative, Ty1-copia subclass [Tanacetum cinerariifolium]
MKNDSVIYGLDAKQGLVGYLKGILLHLAGSQLMLKSSYKAEDGVIISIPPLVGGVADVVLEIKGTEQPIPPAQVVPEHQHVALEILAAHNAWIKGSKEIADLMLMTMELEIQQKQEHLQTMRDFHSCKQEEGQSVSSYVLKMKGYIDNLEHLGHPVTLGLGEWKNKKAYAPKPKIPPPPKREDPAKDSICHKCGETGHWKRNCPQYLAELLKKKITHLQELVVQGLRASRKLKLGALSFKKRIEKLQHDGLLDSTYLRAFEKCVSCMSGKMARKPYTHQVERAKDFLGLIHTDVCVPFKIMSRQGSSYFITFADDFSRYGYVYLLTHKHEVFETFKVFQKEVENQLRKTIKSLCFDRGGEYMSLEFLDHLTDHGIITHRTPPYTPQHNGVSERRNRTLLDMVRSMMSQTTLPKSFWGYALESTACILNMVPTKKVEKTPYERDTLTKPDKLEPRSIKCIFIGYLNEMIGYSFYYPPKTKVLVARNAEFLENSLINQEVSGSLKDLEIIQEEDMHPSIDTIFNHEKDDLEIDEPQSDTIPIHRSTRT